MYSSNSFNVCPHCGKANSLSARYCSGCGKQLAMPEEVVVCHKCHRNNSPMASFCGSCGAPLRVGAQTKICPKCHKEVDVNSNVCSCGYAFGGARYASPETAPVKAMKAKNPALSDPRHKGARAIAIFSIVFLLIFAYLVVFAAECRPAFLEKFDKGMFNLLDEKPYYAYDFIYQPIKGIASDGFSTVKDVYGIGGLIWAAISLAFALTLVVQLVSAIVQLISAKRHKYPNWFHLAMALLTGLLIGLMWLGKWKVGKMLPYLMPNPDIFSVGYVVFLIPAYYLLCFLFSLAFKQKKDKTAAK